LRKKERNIRQCGHLRTFKIQTCDNFDGSSLVYVSVAPIFPVFSISDVSLTRAALRAWRRGMKPGGRGQACIERSAPSLFAEHNYRRSAVTECEGLLQDRNPRRLLCPSDSICHRTAQRRRDRRDCCAAYCSGFLAVKLSLARRLLVPANPPFAASHKPACAEDAPGSQEEGPDPEPASVRGANVGYAGV
jgi:hypothetical protein